MLNIIIGFVSGFNLSKINIHIKENISMFIRIDGAP